LFLEGGGDWGGGEKESKTANDGGEREETGGKQVHKRIGVSERECSARQDREKKDFPSLYNP